MRKILFAILSLVVISIATTGSLTSCKPETKHTDTLDTTVIKPKAVVKADSVAGDANAKTLSVTGKVTDGAMNSVFVEVAPDSTIEFSYPQLDRNNSEVYYNWEIDENITVTYIETTRDGETIDSVVSIQKAQ